MNASARGVGLLDLPNELLVEIARHNYTDTVTTRNVCLVAKHLTSVFQPVLLEHVETKAVDDNSIAKIMQHILSLALSDTSPDTIETKISRKALAIVSVKIGRAATRRYFQSYVFFSNSGPPMSHYNGIVGAAGTFTLAQQRKWQNQVMAGRYFALIRLLLCFVSNLHTLELQNSLDSLPRAIFFQQLYGGALQKLRKLRLSYLQPGHKLTLACHHIMRLPTLRELEFFKVHLASEDLGSLPRTPLQITALRFIRCTALPQARGRLLGLCPNLNEFTYTSSSIDWPHRKGQDGNDSAGRVKQQLFTHAIAVRKITFVNTRIQPTHRFQIFGSLSAFTNLEHLCVNQRCLVPSHDDASDFLLNLPPSLRVLQLHRCMPAQTLDAVNRLLDRGRAHFPNLTILSVRQWQEGVKTINPKQEVLDKVLELTKKFEAVGVMFTFAVVTSPFD